jgi:hypothetical protein
MKEVGWNITLSAIVVALEWNPTFAKAGHDIRTDDHRWLKI